MNTPPFRTNPVLCLIIAMLAAISFITTLLGVLSEAPVYDDAPVTYVCWAIVAVLLAGGLSLAIGMLAARFYRERRVLPLAGMLALTAAAMLWDAAFFQRSYVARLAGTTAEAHDTRQRREEYTRLVREHGAQIATSRQVLERDLQPALQSKREAEACIQFETTRRMPRRARYCGPICEACMDEVARYIPIIERIEVQLGILAQAPATPHSGQWEDLRRFHTRSIDILRQTGSTSFPSGPQERDLLRRDGTLSDTGGIAQVIGMLIRGEWHDSRLYLPLAMAAMCEGILPILCVTGRLWRLPRTWLLERLCLAEEFADRMPSPLGIVWLWMKRLVRNDPEAREHRRRANVRMDTFERMDDTVNNLADTKDRLASAFKEQRNGEKQH